MTFSTKSPSLSSLVQMLGYRRPAGSKTEKRFIADWLQPLGLERDAYGNLFKRIGDAPVLWSSHTDTVHKIAGYQRLGVSADGTLTVADGEASNCLGADCTTGVWLMREMIKAERPGLYVFHRDEEAGGLGSHWITRNKPAFFDGINFAIAFDRRGTTSVITHQGSRCCSDEFGLSLAAQLGMGYKLDDGGVFTDTANYVDFIGECTNISVGYNNEHSSKESQNVTHLVALREKLLALDVSTLTAKREAGEEDFDDWGYKSYAGTSRIARKHNWGGGFDWYGRDDEDAYGSQMSIADIVRDHPLEIADYLEDFGVSADELLKAVAERGGVIRKR